MPSFVGRRPSLLTAARGDSSLTGPSRLVATLSMTPPGEKKTK